ncbi:hypothetical protein C5S36_14560 [Candidatus Methanophagaceae archaeon]|nr:hypothetical protein C5S36_14560 [Methanophagales archaeon]
MASALFAYNGAVVYANLPDRAIWVRAMPEPHTPCYMTCRLCLFHCLYPMPNGLRFSRAAAAAASAC